MSNSVASKDEHVACFFFSTVQFGTKFRIHVYLFTLCSSYERDMTMLSIYVLTRNGSRDRRVTFTNKAAFV